MLTSLLRKCCKIENLDQKHREKQILQEDQTECRVSLCLDLALACSSIDLGVTKKIPSAYICTLYSYLQDVAFDIFL